MDEDTYLEFYIREGMVLSNDKLNDIVQYENNQKAFNKIINLISFKDRTERELITRLKMDKFEDYVIDNAICRAKDSNLINDKEYAKTYTEINIERLSFGKISQKLFEKGISKDIIDELEIRYKDDDLELGLLRKELNKMKTSLMREKDVAKRKSKAINRLIYRKYDIDKIMEVVSNEGWLNE